MNQDTEQKRLKILSIGTEKALFEDGPVRRRIVAQLDGMETTILVLAKTRFDAIVAPHVRVVSTNSWSRWTYVPGALRKVFAMRKLGFDAVITQDPVESAMVGAFGARVTGAVLAIQDHGYHFHGDYYRKESFLNQFRFLFARWAVKRAEAIRVVSKRTEDALIRLGVAQSKLMRFPLGINTPGFLSDSEPPSLTTREGRRESGVESYFLLAARFVPIKRIDLAIHAFSLVSAKNPDVRLKIIGRGPLEGDIRRTIAEFRLEGRVDLLAWSENLSDLYRNAKATLITSDREGFGMTALESLTNGTPVIMTDVGCAGEVVKDGLNGYVVPVGDVSTLAERMDSILADDRSLRENARSFIWQNPTGNMLALIRSALEHRVRQGYTEPMIEPRKTRLLFVTQKIHQNDDDLAFAILWVKEFMRQGVDVQVICLEKRDFDGSFPVFSLGKETGAGKITRALRFLKLIMTLKYDRVFVHMNCEYFTLGGWYWWLRRIPTYLWYTHYTMHIHLFLSGLICRRMFAATPQSMPQYAGNPKKVVTGHGIDVGHWLEGAQMTATERDERRLLTVHRLCRSKRLELVILALKHLPEEYTLTVYGRDVEKDYVKELHELVAKENLQSRVTFNGPVPMDELKRIYPQYRLMVNMASETIDKTMVEAMLFGIFPVTTPGNSKAIGLPAWPEGETPEELAEFILNGVWKAIGEDGLRNSVQEKHSLSALISKMNAYIAPGI